MRAARSAPWRARWNASNGPISRSGRPSRRNAGAAGPGQADQALFFAADPARGAVRSGMTGAGTFEALSVLVGDPGAAGSGFGRRAGLAADGSGATSTAPAPAPDFAAASFLAGGRMGLLGT